MEMKGFIQAINRRMRLPTLSIVVYLFNALVMGLLVGSIF